MDRGCSFEGHPGVMDDRNDLRERESGKYVQTAWLDDDDDVIIENKELKNYKIYKRNKENDTGSNRSYMVMNKQPNQIGN